MSSRNNPGSLEVFIVIRKSGPRQRDYWPPPPPPAVYKLIEMLGEGLYDARVGTSFSAPDHVSSAFFSFVPTAVAGAFSSDVRGG